MKFQIRKTVEHDIGLYKKCLENDEFRWFLYGNNKLNIEESTFYRGKRHQKFIVSRINDDDIEDMGFCDFYYNQDIEEYIYSGGVLPKYFNSGIGLFANVIALSYMFIIDPMSIIKVYIYKYNQRSKRMAVALGFQPYEETNDEYILKLTNNQFNNPFVGKILNRLDILVKEE